MKQNQPPTPSQVQRPPIPHSFSTRCFVVLPGAVLTVRQWAQALQEASGPPAFPSGPRSGCPGL
jgi:hypothetical protein